MKYHVYIQGFTQLGEEETINDYDEPVAAFEDEDKAIWFATHYPFKRAYTYATREGYSRRTR